MKDKEEFSRKDPDASHKAYWLAVVRWILPISFILIGLYITTQRFAPLMNYDESVIGKPLFIRDDGYKVYDPLVFILGMFKYAFNDTYSYYFFKVIPPTLIGIFLAIMTFFILSVIVTSHQKNQHIHGTARWGTEKDLAKFGLLQKRGVICGELNSADVRYKIVTDNGNDKLVLKLHNSITRKYLLRLPPKIAPLICHSGATNTIVFAPTRAGKGVSIITPTLLSYGVPYWVWVARKESWLYNVLDGKLRFLAGKQKVLMGKGSMVVFDPKAENFESSAGFRSQFSTILPFNPMQIRDSHDKEIGTVHYNPIHEIPDDEKSAYAWADMFGEFFFSEGGEGENAFFYKNARDIFTAVVMHVRFSKDIPWKQKTFTTVLEKFSMASDEDEADDNGEAQGCGQAMIEEMKYTVHVHDDGVTPFDTIHNLIVNAANRSKGQTPKERGSIFSTVFSEISYFQDPLIQEVTSYCDFSVKDFINSKNGITLYLIIPYNHLKRIRPLFRLLVNFLIRNFSEGATNANSQKLKKPCLFLLDEFPAMGKFEDIEENAGVLAGYGVTFLIICQSLSQIVKIYGEQHAFLDHCKTVCLFTPGKYQDARSFSEAIGNRSVLLDNLSTSGNKFEAGWNNVSRSSQETSTSLINPDELMKLEFNRCIVMNQGMPPYKAKKVVYYEDPRFKSKAYRTYPKINQVLKRAKTLPSNHKAHVDNADVIQNAINEIQDTEIKFIEAGYDLFA